ncbi:MAG: vWA domain-containing protein [Fervidobacterium sp.]
MKKLDSNKKLIVSVCTFLFILLSLYSCSNIPVASSNIPSDPTGTSKPNVVSYVNDGIYISIDKMPTLLPITSKDYVRVRVSIPGAENLSENELRVFEDNKEQGFIIFKESVTRSKIDIAIILDITGSMGSAITGVKNSIVEFANELLDSGLDIKLAVVPFGDYVNPPSDCISDLNPPLLDLSSPLDVKSYVENKLYASGGGDWPENPYDAIMSAATVLTWRPGSQRSIILITDAPAHYLGDGSEYAHFTKNTMLPYLIGYFTIHSVIVPDSFFYLTNATDFSNSSDPRELSQRTGGLVKYTDSQGNVDLTEFGIAEYIESSWIVSFESDSALEKHTIELFYEQGAAKRYAKLENISY